MYNSVACLSFTLVSIGLNPIVDDSLVKYREKQSTMV